MAIECISVTFALELDREWITAYSPGNIRVSRLFLVITDGAKRRPLLGSRDGSSQGRKDMGDRIQDIVVVTMSEFGRTAQLNAFKMIMASNQKHPAVSPLDPRGK